jgi:hypothetical protein
MRCVLQLGRWRNIEFSLWIIGNSHGAITARHQHTDVVAIEKNLPDRTGA